MANTVTITVNADTKNAEEGLSRISSSAKGAGKKLSMGLTAPIAAIGIGSLLTGAKFEKSMNRVKALSGATEGQFNSLEQQAKDLGASTMFSATEASEAMGFLAMAGFKTNDVLGAMPGVLNLAAAAQMDLGQTADITSNILTGFGLGVEELGRVNDVLVKGMTSANVDLTMLGEAMKYVGPVAAGAGMQFEETAAAIALLGNAGIQGSMAGTSLRAAMTRLLTPSEKAAKTMQKLGINALDSEGNLKSFTDIVGQLENSGMSTADAMTIFGQRAGPAMMALVSQGSGALADMTQSLEDSGGTAQRIADVQMEGMSGAITEMKSAFEGLMIALSEDVLPILTKLIDKITPILQKFVALPAPVKIVVLVLAAVAAAIGPILIAIGFMIPAIMALSGAFAVLSASMLPITLVILGIAAAIAAVIIIWKNWDKIVGFFSATWDMVWGALQASWAAAKALFETVWNGIKTTFETVSDAISGAFNSKWGWILPGGIFLKAFNLIKDNWAAIWAAISILAIVAWEKISGFFVKYFGWALPGGALHTALNKILEGWGRIWDSIKSKFEVVWDAISTKFTDVWGGIKGVFRTVALFVKDIWDKHFGWLRPGGAIHRALDAFKDKWGEIWDGIKSMVKGPVNFIIGGINKLIDVLNGLKIGWEAKQVRGVTVIPAFEFSPINLPHIPKMAKGGIVRSPTLAMLGEAGPEAVVPLGRGMGGGVTVNILGPTYGFDDFEERVSEAISDGVRRGGFSGILAPA